MIFKRFVNRFTIYITSTAFSATDIVIVKSFTKQHLRENIRNHKIMFNDFNIMFT